MFLSVFCFKQKTAYEMRISDWSSDVCSSDLLVVLTFNELIAGQASGAQESFKRLSRCVSAWTFPLLSDRFRLKGQTLDDKGQPTRRHIAGKACRFQASFGQLLREHAGKVVRRLSLHAGRDFF